MKALALAFALAALATAASAQNAATPGGQTVPGYVLMCQVGASSDGKILVAPCGSAQSPVAVVPGPNGPAMTVTINTAAPTCKANPISGKTPPIC